MRLLLDIAAFGLGFTNPAGRCGIYRCIEEFLLHRAGLEVSELALTALRDPAMTLLTEAEIERTHPELLNTWLPAWKPVTAQSRELARMALMAGRLSRSDPQRWLAAAAWRLGQHTARQTIIPGSWDIFHSFSDALPDAARVTATTRILTVHDLTPLTMPELHLSTTRKVFAEAVGSLLASDGWAVCDSEATRQDLLRMTAMPAARTRVILLAADPRFAPASAEAVRRTRARYCIGDQPYFLCLSSVEPRKNVRGMFRAFARFHQQLAQAGDSDLPTLVVAGPTGWMAGAVERELACAKVPVVRTGFIADEDLPALYSGCRAFTYLSFAEGFGLPPLEAMSCGAAVLTSNTTSLPEVVGDGGLMVDPLDEDAIVAALHRLHHDDQLVDELRLRAVARARTFSWDRFAAEHRDLYRELGHG